MNVIDRLEDTLGLVYFSSRDRSSRSFEIVKTLFRFWTQPPLTSHGMGRPSFAAESTTVNHVPGLYLQSRKRLCRREAFDLQRASEFRQVCVVRGVPVMGSRTGGMF